MFSQSVLEAAARREERTFAEWIKQYVCYSNLTSQPQPTSKPPPQRSLVVFNIGGVQNQINLDLDHERFWLIEVSVFGCPKGPF